MAKHPAPAPTRGIFVHLAHEKPEWTGADRTQGATEARSLWASAFALLTSAILIAAGIGIGATLCAMPGAM